MTTWVELSPANPVTDDVLCTYSVASMAIVVFGTWRWRSVAAFPLLMAGTYAGLAAWRFGFGFGLVANALTYWAIAVTVLDQGRGFDAATAVTGLGLPASVRAGISEVGGSVAITSAPGAGTHVELRVPYGAPDPAQPRVVVS